ncbi:MAG TPA: DnaD domain protein [Bacillales bacterium]
MNYIKELKAFKDWLLLNELPTSAIALWHTLMAINNMTGWKSSFNAPNPLVQQLTSLSKQGLVDARKKLIDNSLIEYEKGRKNKAPVYKMVSLVNSLDQPAYQTTYQSDDQSAYQSDDQNLTIPKHKQNQTKKSSSGIPRSRATGFFVRNFGNHSTYIQDKIADWENELSEDVVIASMKIALENNAKSFSYCEPILKEWFAEGLGSLEEVRAYEIEKKRKRKERFSSSSKSKGSSKPRAYKSMEDYLEEEESLPS